jgi:hypothetical protein
MNVKKSIVDFLETSSRFIYGWIADNDDLLGTIILVVHMFLATTMLVLVIVSHTIYPMFWFQFCIFVVMFIVWVQHMILNTCVLTSLERRLISGGDTTSMDPLLNLFGIPITRDTRAGVTLMVSTIITGILGLELVARSVMFLRSNLGVSTWI